MKRQLKLNFIFIFFTITSFGQGSLGQLYYGSSKPAYVPPPKQQIIESSRQAENAYYDSSQSQQITCDDLINYVLDKGSRRGSVGSLSLMNSSWLKSVEAYSIENTIVVIAEIKRENSYSTKKYIFCGVPSQNWDRFSSGLYNMDKTYGEKFHDYIMDYQCNCN